MLRLLTIGLMLAAGIASAAQVRVHSVTDISHEFSFYFDGRYAANYLDPGNSADARNWATLHTADLRNANLLVLQGGASPCVYSAKDSAAVGRFLAAGGGVAVYGDHALFRDEREYHVNALLRGYGAAFVDAPAVGPLRAAGLAGAPEVVSYGGKVIRLARPGDWRVLVQDANGAPVLAWRRVGRGRLLVSTRGLVGRQPDAGDPINAAWWRPLLCEIASGKQAEAAAPPAGAMPEKVIVRDGLRVRCTEYLQPYADAVFGVYAKARPLLETILGVPPSPNMLTSLILLPTGGGGFSDGTNIALGIWWGDFPAKTYGMVELLGHEATHSWVLPFAEPMWNEGLATYVGIQLGRAMGLTVDADASLKSWLDGARRHDPDMRGLSILDDSGSPHVVAMGKPMWIWEELRRERPDILARYFRAKRRLVTASRTPRYTADQCVAVLSEAMGRDLFPWFRAHGAPVNRPAGW